MGRSLKSAEAIPSVGEAWALRAPRIYYLHPQNVGGQPDWRATSRRLLRWASTTSASVRSSSRAAAIRFWSLIWTRADPRLGIAGSPEDAVREIAALCRGQGLRLFLDIVLDRLAADGPSVRQADGLYECHDHPRHGRSSAGSRRAECRDSAPRRHKPARAVVGGPSCAPGAGRRVGFRLVGLDLVPGEALRQIRRRHSRTSELAASGAGPPAWIGRVMPI